MTSITKGLVAAFPASTPKVIFPRFDIDGIRGFLGDFWLGHVWLRLMLWINLCWMQVLTSPCGLPTLPLRKKGVFGKDEEWVMKRSFEGGLADDAAIAN
ncbi:hypothetical protein [Roseovarius rhodophyticola]|uniref:Uncharacterized protein n=1 Tax=Roseovarius rhodophyticola TaxID=3080827 RepID=A0ABZ2TK34_9RHOB|nr:hypothetical protein [Roseovarius sp. W115]MDV2930729.1 hypothetical protein [Roseovarius sp. W115]